MLHHRRLLTGALCAMTLAASVSAAEHTLSPADFGEGLTGVWITAAPEGDALRLGSRAIREGDVLTVSQLQTLTLRGEGEAAIRYLPIREEGVDSETELVFSLRGRKNEAPAAEDSLMETYRNLPNEGLLAVSDPEEEALTFTLTRAPRRGEVILRSDGSFAGETVNGQLCFSPDEPVSRGQFLAMLMQVLQMPVDRSVEETGFVDESPKWLKPYLAAALRSGIIAGYPGEGGAQFRAAQTVTAGEAERMTRNALRFAVPAAAMDGTESETLDASPMTRSDAARKLYQLSLLRREQTGFFGMMG